MEQEMLTELQAKHEAELKEVEALSNQFNNKLLEIHGIKEAGGGRGGGGEAQKNQ